MNSHDILSSEILFRPARNAPGVRQKFNVKVSGTINLAWDRGVDTGVDIMTNTCSLGAGAVIKAGPGNLRLSAVLPYLTAGSQSGTVAKTCAATADGDWAFGVTGSYLIKF